MHRLIIKTSAVAFFASIALVTTSCENHSNPPPVVVPEPDPDPEPVPDPDPIPVVNPGDPRADLTTEELATFNRGRAMFVKRFKPSEGLGPLYNATSCSSCHSKPVPGGASELYRNFYVASWGFPPFVFNLPGLPSPVVPAFGSTINAPFSLQNGRTIIPEMIATVPVASDQRNGIPVFGTGLFELISDATILANADPDDADGDGISGRANNDGAGLGRFGSKAQANNIELFTRAPLFNQMGISSNPVQGSAGTVSFGHGALMQGSATPNAPTADNDGVPDPEISTQDLSDLIAFSRFLAQPQKKVFNNAATRGEQTFAQIGCTACHIPSLESSKGPVEAFTDLLIHNMGSELAGQVSFGTPQVSSIDPVTTEAEWRTAPLWGVSNIAPYLHDGRAPTLLDAILMHGGEGEASRVAFQALSPVEQEDILEFLRHL
tara:strand:+ start:10943 stop:12247 length:1305 start_codon:yes stop_codon:yes gene_type:complete